MVDDAIVEGVAGDADAALAERLDAAAIAGAADLQKREVAGAAAEISDEDKFVSRKGGLVGVSRTDGLELEVYGVEAGVLESDL